jgi:hypothetical protein
MKTNMQDPANMATGSKILKSCISRAYSVRLGVRCFRRDWRGRVRRVLDGGSTISSIIFQKTRRQELTVLKLRSQGRGRKHRSSQTTKDGGHHFVCGLYRQSHTG